jgi:PAS domain S-box-containing protein
MAESRWIANETIRDRDWLPKGLGAEDLSSEDAEAILRSLAGAASEGDRELQQMVSPLLEMTERDRSTAGSARRSEARYRVLVEQIPAITFMAALDEGLNEIYVSPQIEKMLGYSQKEWLEDPILWYSRLHPEDRERWHHEFAQTCATGTPFYSEYRFLARDGRIVWVHGEARIVRDDLGQPLFLQGVAFDITDQKKAEEALRRSQDELEELVQLRTAELSETADALQAEIAEHERTETTLRDQEARLRSVVQTAVDGIVVIDERGIIEAFNPAAERLFGYGSAEVLGRNVSMLMPLPYREEHHDYLTRYRASGVKKIIGIGREVVGQRKDGSTFPMDLSVSEMVLRDGRRFTGMVRDLTERRNAEERLAKAREAQVMADAANRAKNEFLSRMSHELRTPLNAVLGFGQLLEMNALTEEQRECVEQINRGGKHLLGLINEVLDIARIEAGRMDLSPEPVRVVDAFQDALELVQPLATKRNIQFHIELDAEPDFYVLADHQKLKQVLLNLLSNAVKYNRDGGEVRFTCQQLAPGRLGLAVSDTGWGIEPNKLGRLFVPFDRLGAEQTGVEGCGLGLAFSKRLVELMGGKLTVTSAGGVGSRFCIELAQAGPSQPPTAAEGAGALKPAVQALDAHTLLYIEDNLDNLRLVQRILAHRPRIQLLTAMQGSLAVDLARQHRPDLIFLDVHLPDLSGDQVLQRLQAAPETRRIPVVVVSADATARQIERLRAAGAYDYLTKPLDVPRFLQIVDDLLSIERPKP